VKDAAAFAGQLVDALLDFSRMGRSALKQRPVDTASLVDGLVRELKRLEPQRAIEWEIADDAAHAVRPTRCCCRWRCATCWPTP
jgi:chemotaxis family two-component system sensor kinase Cph1